MPKTPLKFHPKHSESNISPRCSQITQQALRGLSRKSDHHIWKDLKIQFLILFSFFHIYYCYKIDNPVPIPYLVLKKILMSSLHPLAPFSFERNTGIKRLTYRYLFPNWGPHHLHSHVPTKSLITTVIATFLDSLFYARH